MRVRFGETREADQTALALPDLQAREVGPGFLGREHRHSRDVAQLVPMFLVEVRFHEQTPVGARKPPRQYHCRNTERCTKTHASEHLGADVVVARTRCELSQVVKADPC